MLKYIKFLLAGFLFFSACSTLKVNVDYDDAYDFAKVKTYMVKHNPKEGESTLVNDRITSSLENVLDAKGYKKVTSEADLIFVYHYAAKDKIDIQTDYHMIGIRRYGFGGTMVATTTAYEYTEGTIIIDAFDTKTNKIVWRSVGSLELQEQETPEEKRAYVQKIIAKLMEKFPSTSL